MTPHATPPATTQIYRQLIARSEQVVARARRVLQQTEKVRGKDPQGDAIIRSRRSEIGRYRELGERVIAQTRRRPLEGEQVRSTDTVYSIFEPHTDLIRRGKAETPNEFGRSLSGRERSGSDHPVCRVVGKPCRRGSCRTFTPTPPRNFGHAPHLYGSDRGFHSQNNLQACRCSGVKIVGIPQRGGKKFLGQKLTRRARPLKRANTSARAWRDASRCSSAAGA
jgi:IS5 family transposase